jgi:hypothetical protein
MKWSVKKENEEERREEEKPRSPSHPSHHMPTLLLSFLLLLEPPHLCPRPCQEHANPPHHERIPALSYHFPPCLHRFHRFHRFLLQHASHRDAERGKGDVEKGTVQLLLLRRSPGEDVLDRVFGEIGRRKGRVLRGNGRPSLLC